MTHDRGTGLHAFWLCLLALLALLGCGPTATAAASEPAARMQATYLVNFIRYTEWPSDRFESKRAPYVVWVAGPGWLAGAVRAVSREVGHIDQRPLQVRRLRLPRNTDSVPDDLLQQIRASHALLVHSSHAERLPQLLSAVDGEAVLTVGTVDGFVGVGGMLELVKVDASVSFKADPEAIRSAGLRVSARVLKMARNEDARP